MTETPIHVSCHAVRRYAERRLGVVVRSEKDTDAMQELADRGVDVLAIRLLLRRLGEFARAFGAPAVKSNGVKIIVDDGVVVTVKPTRSSREADRHWPL